MEETKKIETPSKFKSVVESIESMSVIDLHELVKFLEEKFLRPCRNTCIRYPLFLIQTGKNLNLIPQGKPPGSRYCFLTKSQGHENETGHHQLSPYPV